MVAKYWLETVARISVEIDVASEFRYRRRPCLKGGLAIFISIGETADTLAALRYCKAQKQHILAITNVPESSMERESHVLRFNSCRSGNRRCINQKRLPVN